MKALGELDIEVEIDARPNEVAPAIPFAEDHEHASYDPEAAHLFWQQLLQADRVIGEFRSHFVGKVSPVHFFWAPLTLPAPPSPVATRPATQRGPPTDRKTGRAGQRVSVPVNHRGRR